MPNAVSSVTEFNINKLKGEINSLVEKIAYRTRKENEILKIENAKLKEEVERLRLLSSGGGLNYIKAITEN
jgi:regulator of replication initiation timing